MGLTTIQLFATILSSLIIIKFLFFLFFKNSWMNFAKVVYVKNNSLNWLFGILALVVLYYLLQTMNIIQVLAVTLFVMLLMGMVFATFGNEFIKMAEKMMKKGLPASIWINFLIWIVMSIWALYLIFF